MKSRRGPGHGQDRAGGLGGGAAYRAGGGRAPGYHGSNTTLKSFWMLTTVQPRSFASASAFSEPVS